MKVKGFMRGLLIAAAFVLIAAPADAQKRKERKVLFGSSYNYEVTTIGVGQDGTKAVKVWGYGKKVDQAVVQAKKNAVAAAILRGYPGSASANATPALMKDPNAEENNIEYFEDFFETGGKYLKFVNLTTDGVPAGQDRLKVKGGYKVAIYVQVMYHNLRKQLEADGVIKKLGSGF